MDHHIDDEEMPGREREVTLSTGAILGIFLGLVILCGGFFGFGYNMGRKSAPTPLNLSEVNSDPGITASTSVNKPAAGSPIDDTPVVAVTAPPKPAKKVTPVPPPSTDSADAEPAPKSIRSADTASIPSAPIVRQPAVVPPAALSPSASTGNTTGFYMVQVAAVSHKEDADLLMGALHARGYAVMSRTGAGDSFIHVQVGPFHDKKDADAMRQRLLTDGYNAIVKQ